MSPTKASLKCVVKNRSKGNYFAPVIAQMMDNSSIPFDERLWEAYVRTTYRVLREDEKVWDIQIGHFHPCLDQYLHERGLHTWVFITAWNPGSRLLSSEENRRRNQALLQWIVESALPYFPGLGMGADGDWPAEESYWVAGLSRKMALEWGQFWGQNAVVWGKLRQKAGLYWMT